MAEPLSRRLNDQELRSAKLLVNPSELEGISSERPDTQNSPVIMGEYHLEPHDAVRCSYCPQHTTHQHGFVIRSTRMKMHLIGSTCGPRHFGLQFGLAQRGHKELLDRQRYIKMLDCASAARDEVVRDCNAVLFSPLLRSVEEKGKELNKASGDSVMRLRALVLRGEVLSEDVRVRDVAAEKQRDERFPDQAPGSPIYRTERAALGPLLGAGMLDAEKLREAVFSLKVTIDESIKLLRGDTDSLSTRTLRDARDRLSKAYEAANSAINAINNAPSFFSKENLERLVRWSAGSHVVTLDAEGTALLVIRPDRPKRTIEMPTGDAIRRISAVFGDLAVEEQPGASAVSDRLLIRKKAGPPTRKP